MSKIILGNTAWMHYGNSSREHLPLSFLSSFYGSSLSTYSVASNMAGARCYSAHEPNHRFSQTHSPEGKQSSNSTDRCPQRMH